MSRSPIGILLACHCSILGLALGICAPARSQLNAAATTEVCEINLNVLKSSERRDPNIITADTASAAGSTIPSLWWTSEQSPTRLVNNWIAHRDRQQIYLLVNNKYWNAMDYIDRYRTIDRFGRVARDYGYELKICNLQKIALAGYSCPTSSIDLGAALPPSCQIWLNNSNQAGMGVQRP